MIACGPGAITAKIEGSSEEERVTLADSAISSQERCKALRHLCRYVSGVRFVIEAAA